MADRIDVLFGDLQSRGYAKDKTNQEFRDYMLAPGKQGYENRKQFFEDFKSQGLTDLETYEDFAQLMGLHAGTPERRNKPTYQPTAEEMAGFQSTINSAGRVAANAPQSYERKARLMQKRQGLQAPQRVNLGESNNLTPTEQHFNLETGETEQGYMTSAGNEYGSRAIADMEQREIDKAQRNERYRQTLPGQLEDAYAERDRLNAELAKYQGQWVDQDGRVHYANRGDDESVASLEAALRQNQQRITALEAERDDDGGTQFWRGFIDAAKNPSVQTFGLTDFNDMLQLMRIKNKVDNAQAAGQQAQLTPAEQQLMESTYLNNYAQSAFGENRGFMYRAGGISMQALPFVAEFMTTGGFSAISEKGAELGVRAAEKWALEGLSKVLVKNLGIVAGDVAAGWAMANTTGAFRTVSDVMQRNIGEVAIDENGNLGFEGGKSLGRSIYEAEVANTLEYYTEKLGEHLKLGSRLAKGAEKMGLSRLSKAVNYLSGNKWLEMGGIQDYPSEVVEEQANLLLNAALVGDNTFTGPDDPKSVINPKTQLDIWGGMLFSIGLMQAPRLANTAYNAAGYYAYKKNVDISDGNAAIVFGRDNWDMIKEQIDNCDNEQLPALLESIVNGKMNSTEKLAATQYAGNLIKMRGYNMGMMAGQKDEEESTTPEGVASQSINQGYQAGRQAQMPDEMKMYVDEADAARESLSQYGQEFANMVTNSQDPIETLSYLMNNRNFFDDEQVAAAADFYQKTARALGVMDAAVDNVDIQVEQANAEVRGNTHYATGNVILAKGPNDLDYYIIGGDVIADLETGGVSVGGTGGAAVVKDPITGKVSVKSPQELVVYSIQNADELIQQNETTLRQQQMQQADDDITFGSPANEVFDLEDTVTLQDGEGGMIQGQIVTLPNAVDGVFVVQTNDGRALQMTADDMNRRIVEHNGMQVERATQPQPAEEPAGVVAQEPGQEGGVAETQQQTPQGSINTAGGETRTTDTGEESNQQATALSRIPVRMDANGKPVKNRKGRPILDWHKASVEDAAAALVETTDGDMVMARDTASDMVKNAENLLTQIRKQKPKGEDPIEIAQSRVEIRRQEQEQQAIIKHWKDVNQHIQQQMREETDARQAAIKAAKSEEQRQREAEEARQRQEQQAQIEAQRRREQIEKDRKERTRPYTPLERVKRELADSPEAQDILNQVEPQSLEEWVSSLLRPHSMLWDDEKVGEHTVRGLQSELGLPKKEFERIGKLLAKRSEGGRPFAEIIDEIHEGLPEAMKEQYSDQDVRNALLELFGEGNADRMMHLTEENRIAQAREAVQEMQRRAEEYEMEAWAEFYHLTPEERETFEDFMQQPPEEPEQEIINQIIAENGQNSRSALVDNESINRADEGQVEGGEGQVQGQSETAGNGDNADEVTQGPEAATGEQAPAGDNVAGGTQGVDRDSQGRRYVDLRANLKYFLNTIGVDDDVMVDRMSNYEVDQLIAMIEDWEAVNSDYGEVIEQQKEALKSKNKAVRDAAKAKVDEAQAKSNEVFEPIEQYVEGLQVKYGTESEEPFEGAIPTPSIDEPRYRAIRQALIDAYRSGDAAAIQAAAQSIQQYVDEGLDSVGDHTEVYDEAEEYNGNDPEKLADQYIIRTFWDRYLDDDEDQEYIKTGLKSDMRQIAPAEQIKPIDQRDAVRPGSAELGVNEANEKARQHLQAIKDKVAEHTQKYRTLAPLEVISVDSDEDMQRIAGDEADKLRKYLKETKLPASFDPDSKKIYIFAENLSEDDIEEAIFHESLHRGWQQYYGDGLIEIAEAFWETESPTKPEVTKEHKEKIAQAYAKKPNSIKEEYLTHLLGKHMVMGKVERILARLGAEHQEIVNNILHNIGYDTAEETKQRAGKSQSSEETGVLGQERLQENRDGGRVEPYTSFEELAADTEVTVTDPAMQKALRKIVDKQFLHGSSNTRDDKRGFEYRFVYMTSGTTKAERGLLQPWASQRLVEYNDDNPIATWIDEKEKRVYFIKYNPPGTAYGWDFIIAGYKEMHKPIGTTSTPEQIAQEEQKVDANPTDGQKEAGNYQKGHIKVDGYDITIENPKGSTRRGTDSSGKQWEQEMHNTYGYIRGTEGTDGDHIDVFLSDNPTSGNVYVVDQVNPSTGEFDEHKVMYGFATEEEARQAYLSNYSDGWQGLGNITGVSREDFKKWVESSHRKTKPFAEYKGLKKKPAGEPAGSARGAVAKPKREHKRIVSDDQMEELRKKLREKFGTLNAGIDVERMLLGAMYAVGKIERGVTKFADYAREMVDEIGDSIRPYLKAFYNAVRDMPEAAEYRDQMDTPEYVEAFDVDNFDKKAKVPDAITKAQQVVRNDRAKKQVKKIEKEVKQKITQGDLFAGDLFGAQEEAAETQQPTQQQKKEEKKPVLDKKDYRTYMTPEAREYFAEKYSRYAHTELAFIEGAVRDGVIIPVEELAKIPEIVEAEQRVKAKESLKPFTLTDEEVEEYAHRLLDANHGSAVYENGKIHNVDGRDDFTGQVRQERKAFVIIGRPAGGKSSVFANPLSNQHGARIIDSDVVKEWFDEFDDGYGAGYVQNMSSKVADRALDIAAQNGDNLVIPRIGGNSVMTVSVGLRALGYDVQLYYNDVVPDTSYMRSNSRFAKTGRYLSLDYLTSIKDKPSKNFSNFAKKTIGDYLDECTEEQIQKLRGRIESLAGGQRSDLWRALSWSLDERRRGDGNGGVSADVERPESDGTSARIDFEAPIFSYAEWKSNDVAFGEKPKEIWNSKSGKPMPGKKEVKNNESKQEVSREPESAGEGTGQASGAAERTGTERSPEPNRAERSGSGRTINDVAETQQQTQQPAKPKQELHKNKRNNVGERGKDYAPTSPKARFNANVEAIRIMRRLMEDGVEVPTKDQMEALRQYSGWGGLGTYFNDETSAENKILRDLLDDDEYKAATLSIKTAYFTPAYIIDSMWDIAEAMGFKGGSVLEGSAGIGNIIGQMPRKLSSKSDIEAVEIDKISGNILKLLYPDAKVNIQGFQDTMVRNGSVDLAITNVPFAADLSVIDKVDKDLSRRFRTLHDFCIAKNIRKLREGGIGIFISTSGTLDKSNDLRAWITDEGQADVVGAFRLNNETFGGTTATSDIIVVRKRVNGKKSPNAIDISTATPMRVGTYEDKFHESHQVTMTVNDYFKEHPKMMAGEMAFGYEKGETFRPGSYGLYPTEGKDQGKMLAKFAKSMKEEPAGEPAGSARGTVVEKVPNQLTMVKEGRMLVDDNGRLCVSQYGEAVPLNLNTNKVKGYTKEQCFKDYQEVQKAVDNALQQQLNDPDDAALKPKLDALNKAYDKFVKRYGYLHKNTAISFLRNDIDFPTFLELEKYSETKDMKGKVTVTTKKSPIFTQRVLGFKTEPKPKTIKDALTASIFKTNSIDLEWITAKLNEVAAPPNGENWTVEDVRKGILVSRLGFENPSTGQLEVRHMYLSGNVREKLAIAEAYNTDGKYAANVEELRKVVPMDIPAHLIDFTLGSSWIPNELYLEYLRSEFGLPENIKLTHIQGTWVLDVGNKWSAERSETNKAKGVYSQMFRSNILGSDLVVAALNNRPYKVSRQSKDEGTIVDREATSACNVRIDEIKDGFKQYIRKRVQEDTELGRRIEKIYNDKFNALVPLRIDDEMLPERFEDANMNISLYDHQKRGVLRGVTSPTMLAHEVGTGKSFTLISTAMEMRRLGTARKPMIVVQNATVAQMTADAKLLYPNAKVLSLSEKDRDAEGRRAFYAKIRFNDWDMIIIPQSTLDMIPDSPQRELQFIQEQIDEKKHIIELARAAKMDAREIRRLENDLRKKEQEYGDTYLDNDPANNSQLAAPKKGKKRDAKREAASMDKAETKAREKLDRAVDDVQYFDDLGVDAILVDEAHGYKHLGFETTLGRSVKGVDPSYSKKCAGLYNKTRAVFEKAGWKNVVFATGTPISNTAAEIWTFMKYLMPADVMKANDIYYFDDFVHNFGSINQMLEFKTNGKFNEVTRFAAYVNRPELMRIWMQVADIVRTEEVGEVKSKVPEKENGKDQDVFLPQSPSLVSIMAAVRAELERFENMDGKEKRENSSIPLTMYGIAKRAAIDPRLVDADAPDEPKSKTNAAVKEIVKDLEATKKYKGTVAVFCDNQNRKGSNGSIEFNIFDDMKEKLVKQGVPEAQIAIIKSSMSITAKQKIFDKVNAGDVRVILGSTQTLGTGVNIQERLHLLIHMDAPDRPMDYTQRNGRIERQGNLHREWGLPIRILRFGVEDSLDVTAYQRLKTKSGFIDSIMNGKSALANNQTDRTIEEEEEGLFDNPVAVLSGSQFALKKNQAERQLRKMQGKYNAWEADQIYVSSQLRTNEAWIKDRRLAINENEQALARIREMFPDGKVKTITVAGVAIDMTKDDGAKKLGEVLKEKINDPVNATVKKLRESQFYDDETQHYAIELDGYKVNFVVNISRTSEWDYNTNKMRTVVHKTTSYKSPDLRIDDGTMLSSSKSIREHLDNILEQYVSGEAYTDAIDAAKASIERTTAESAQLKEREGQPFQFTEDLEQAKKQVEEYTELMKKELQEKEAKYAEQAKETGENGGFDLKKAEENEDENLYSAAEDDVPWEDREPDEDVFYSNAKRAVEGIRQEKATPEQWLSMIQKAGGLKAAEDRWLGLSEQLNDAARLGIRSVTKDAILNYIKGHQIVVEETRYARSPLDMLNEEFLTLRKKYMDAGDVAYLAERKAMNDLDEKYPGFGKATYLQHFDDGTVYVDYDYDYPDEIRQFESNFDKKFNVIDDARLQYTTKGLENKQEIALTVPTIEPYNQDDEIHFGDAGGGRAVAWIRFGETTDADGNRVLVIDEIQSKRHQDGREKGYGILAFKNATIGEYRPTDEETEYEADIIAPNGNRIGVMTRFEYEGEPVTYAVINNDGTHMTSARPTEQEALSAMDAFNPNGVPDAPFEKNWHELAMKRMLRYAAENGYDKVAWTTGAQQADRYDIGRVVKEIVTVEDGDNLVTAIHFDGLMMTLVTDKQGNIIEKSGGPSPELLRNANTLQDIVGMDLSKRILSREGRESERRYNDNWVKASIIDSEGLRVGAEGMRGFYDEILPRFMNKYGKKWGVSVGEVELPHLAENGQKMHAVSVTPDMKESVMQGQPMFRGMEQFAEGQTFLIHRTDMQSSYNLLGRSSTYSTELMPDEYVTEQALLDAIRNQYPEYFATIEDGNVKMESWQHVMAAAAIPESTRKSKGAKNYVERKTRNAINAVKYLAEQMGLDVEVLTTTEGLTGKEARAKGIFNPKTGKIRLVLPNCANQSDLIKTLLHEGVAHFGLRKMFGPHFATFLDNVYNNVSPEVKRRIDAAMKQNGWSRQVATEEYLARLAERTDFEHATNSGWWQKIKRFFVRMLADVGLVLEDPLTDNELRYILWRSYDNLLHPDRRRNIFDRAKEVTMQRRFGIERYVRERERLQRTGKVDTSRIAAEATKSPTVDMAAEEMLNNDIKDVPSEELLLTLQEKEEDERNETINELVRRVREGNARIVRMGQEVQLDRENDAQIAGTIVGGWELGLSSLADGTLRGVVQGRPEMEGRPSAQGQDTSPNRELPIISWAKATGHYYNEEQVKNESLDKRIWHSGAESDVYRSADGKKVIKFMAASDYYQNTLLKHMDGIALQNSAGFDHLTVLGYSVNWRGQLQIVLEQDLVDGVTVDDIFDDEPISRVHDYIDSYLEEVLGFTPYEDEDGNPCHVKDGIVYKDIHGSNMLVDKNNNRHVIDCYVSRLEDDGRKRAPGFSIEDNNAELYSIRTKEPPKKTGIGYKVFVLKDGQLYPPMVANPNGEGTPIGRWLDADAAPIAGTSKTGRPQVKAGGKGTQGGSGQLAYRPGWHLFTIPYALQFNRKDQNGERTLFPNNFVWAEVEYAEDVDYQDEARQEGMNANGKYQHSLAGLKHVPTDGSYKYRTNPDPRTDEWVITGAMRVNKILSREEVDELVRKAGREPQKIQDGDVLNGPDGKPSGTVAELNAEIQATKEADEMGLLFSADEDRVDDVAQEMYEKAVAQEGIKFKEAWQDSMVSLKLIQNAIARETGKVATGAEDAYRYENRMHGRAKNMTEQYDWRFYRPMLKAFNDFCNERGLTQEQGMEYLISKSGLERNVYYAFRDGAKAKVVDEVKQERDKLEKDYANKRISEADYLTRKQELDEQERTGVDEFMQQVREMYPYQHAKEEYDAGNISYTEYLRIIETVIRGQLKRKTPKRDADGNIVSDNYYDDNQQDYSGLTETFAKEMYDAAQRVKKQAQRAIDPQERRALWAEYDKQMRNAYITARQVAEDAVFAAEGEPAGEPAGSARGTVADLWRKINAATEETLRQSYESGLIDRNNYNKVRAMFDFYIPLRGWEEDKASDVYTYMGRDNVFSPAVKKTWGRRSRAENPLAYIGNIAVSTILSGHRNQMKQHFLNYVMNNPTSLVSISESWYENIAPEGESPVWILRTADTAGKSGDEIAQIVNDFNEEMYQKQREGKAMPVQGRLRLDVNATKGQKAEHVVEVQRAGHTYQLYINGNPKAAQALNGSAARAVSRISDTWLGKKITKINRDMAMFFTSKNPAFVVSNLSRDLNMAGASVAINEGGAYNARFIANVVKVLRPRIGESSKWIPASKQPTGLMPDLMRKWQKGTLDDSNEVERYFKEFMDEGGETGFVNMLSVDSFKEKMQKEIAEMNGSSLFGSRAKVKETSIHKGLRLLGDVFEFYNRCAEDATRFIVYMTSRQMGKTLEESIADAKDVTLNFNRKGTGGMGNAEVRDLFIFVNPAIQALANMYRMAKNKPLKFGAVTAAFVAGGALMPVINQWLLNMFGDDDDKQAYWNLPPWVRKNNLVFWIPFTKNFVTIPLAQEFRVFYGVGEMMSSAIMDHPVDKWGLEVFSSVADLVPINPTGNGGNLMVDFAPTMVQPLMQVGENVDFTGKPIWKENQGNKHAPMYTKAYISTPTWMVKLSEGLNDVTGGNEGKKGVVERNAPFWGDYINNPAVWNHLLQGYFGGMYNTIAKTFDVGVTAVSGDLPKIYQTPVINRFLNRPVERDNAGVLGEDYYSLTENRDALQYELRTWQRKAADGEEGAQEHVDEILDSPEWKKTEVVSHYEKIIKDLKAGERVATRDADKYDIKESISLYKQQMMEELNALDAGVEPLEAALETYRNAKTFAEKNRLRMRIERLMMRESGRGTTTNRTKGGNADVEKALSYIREEEKESYNINENYLEAVSAENIRDDARIKVAKAKIKPFTDEYKQLVADGKHDKAAQYRQKHLKYFVAQQRIDQLSRAMNANKKLLGKGNDKVILRLIDSQRNQMIKVIEGIE